MIWFLKKLIKKIVSYSGYEVKPSFKTIPQEKAALYSNIINSEVSNPSKIPASSIVQYSFLSSDVLIGERTVIYKALLFGTINIGNNTTINGPGTEFHAIKSKITIGNFCSIARHTAIQDHNHDIENITTYYIKHHIFNEERKESAVSKGDVLIGNDVWIGTQSIILSGVTVGDGAVIAANSVVTKNIPPYAIVGGTPAKVLRYRFSEDIIKELIKVKWWDWDVKKIKRNRHLFYGKLTIEKLKNIID